MAKMRFRIIVIKYSGIQGFFISGCLAILFFMVSFPEGASAQANEVQKLHDIYMTAGRSLYFAGKYEDAIVQFNKAFDVIPDSKIYFNIAQSHRQLKQPEKAIFYYEKFLNALPIIGGIPEDKKISLIADINILVKELRAAAEKERLQKETAEKEKLEMEKVEEVVPVVPVVPAPVRASSGGLGSQWWFWTGVGLTTVFTAATVWTGLQTIHYRDKWVQDWKIADRDQAVFYQNTANLSLLGAATVGIALAVTSWLHLARAPAAEGKVSQVSLLPGCDGDACMLSLTFGF